MVNSETAFPVELVYATRGNPMSNFGSIQGSLPRPDMIVTRTNWDVFVPAQPRYGAPKSNMEILAQQVMTSAKGASIELLRGAVANVISGEPLHIDLPAQGLLFRFAKLYANQSPEDAHFSMRYVNRSAGLAGMWLSLLATLAVWAGIAWLGRAADTRPVSRSLIPGLSLVLGGAIVLTVSISVLRASVIPPSVLSLAVAISLAGRFAWQWWNRNKKEMHARS
jgi:hypothetical protein